MKLYSTAYSERASKSQGGNDYIRVELTAEIDGRRRNIAHLTLYPETATEPVTVYLEKFKTNAKFTIYNSSGNYETGKGNEVYKS